MALGMSSRESSYVRCSQQVVGTVWDQLHLRLPSFPERLENAEERGRVQKEVDHCAIAQLWDLPPAQQFPLRGINTLFQGQLTVVFY